MNYAVKFIIDEKYIKNINKSIVFFFIIVNPALIIPANKFSDIIIS